MYCLKCGRETQEDKVFCEECLQLAQIYPVKPGTPVQIPRQDSTKKTPAQKRSVSTEEQLEAMRKKLRRMGILLFVVTVALALSLGIVFNII